jgi:hypothetical protein
VEASGSFMSRRSMETRSKPACFTPCRRTLGVFGVQVVDRGERLWLEMPKPGPTLPLRYVGAGSLVAEPDPDALTVPFSEGGAPINEIGVFMSSMHWHGVRAVEPAGQP